MSCCPGVTLLECVPCKQLVGLLVHHPSSDLPTIEAECAKFETYAPRLLPDVSPGIHCVALNPNRERFVRARIEDTSDREQIVTCFALDYGDRFQTPVSDLRPQPKCLSPNALPYLTRVIYLSGIDPAGGRVSELGVVQLGRTSSFSPQCMAFLQDQVDMCQPVEISVDGFSDHSNLTGDVIVASRSLSKILCEKKWALPKEPSVLSSKSEKFFSLSSLGQINEFNHLIRSVTDYVMRLDGVANNTSKSPSPSKYENHVKQSPTVNGDRKEGESSPVAGLRSGSNVEDDTPKLSSFAQLMRQKKQNSKSSTPKKPAGESNSESESQQPDVSLDCSSVRDVSEADSSLMSPIAVRESTCAVLMSDLSRVTHREVDKFDWLKSHVKDDALVMGMSAAVPWSHAQALKEKLERPVFDFGSVSPLMAHGFPAVARTCADFVAVERSPESRLKFIAILSQWIFAERKNEDRMANQHIEKGPFVIILAPGWRKIKQIGAELRANSRIVCTTGVPNIVESYGYGVSNADYRSADFLIIKPDIFREVIIKDKTNFNRMKLLIIEDADIVAEKYANDFLESMKSFQKMVGQRTIPSEDWTLWLLGESWNPKIHLLLTVRNLKGKKYKKTLSICFTDLMHASNFLGTRHVPIVYFAEESKSALLIEIVQRADVKRLMVFCSHEDTCMMLGTKFQEINCHVIIILHETVEYPGKGPQVVVTTDEQDSRFTEFSEIDMVVHYELPAAESESQFVKSLNRRVWCLDKSDNSSKTVSFYFLSKADRPNPLFLLESYFTSFKTLQGATMKEYRKFMTEFRELFERKKTYSVELCRRMLMNPQRSNFCDDPMCRLRHIFLPEDEPGSDPTILKIPDRGFAKIKVRQILDANLFYATIESHRVNQNEPYEPFSQGTNRRIENQLELLDLIPAMEISKNLIYAYQCNGILRRAKVLGIFERDHNGKPRTLNIMRIDLGDELPRVSVADLYHIPEDESGGLSKLPGMAIRCVISGIIPIESDGEFPVESRQFVQEHLFGRTVECAITFAVGSTIFVDAIQERERLPDGSYCTVAKMIKPQLLNKGFCVKNEDQIPMLHKKASAVFKNLPELDDLFSFSLKHHKQDTLPSGEYSRVFCTPKGYHSPNCIFVMRETTLADVRKLEDGLKQKYAQMGRLGIIEEGKLCICEVERECMFSSVLYNEDNKPQKGWYRASIHSSSIASRRAEVFLLDWGETHRVRFNSIRQADPAIFRAPSAAICVNIESISPIEASGYTSRVRSHFAGFTLSRAVFALPNSKFPSKAAAAAAGNTDSCVAVELFERQLEDESAPMVATSRILTEQGLTLGPDHIMQHLFCSDLSSQLLQFHRQADVEQKIEILNNIGEPKNTENFIQDLLKMFTWYSDENVLVKLLRMLLELSVHEFPEGWVYYIVKTNFGCRKLSFEIVDLCCQLMAEKLEPEGFPDLMPSYQMQLSISREDERIINSLLELMKHFPQSVSGTVADSINLWRADIQHLLENYCAEQLKHLLTRLKEWLSDSPSIYAAFCENPTFYPVISALIRLYSKSSTAIQHKIKLCFILSKLFEHHNCRNHIAMSNLKKMIGKDLSKAKNSNSITLKPLKILHDRIQEYCHENLDSAPKASLKTLPRSDSIAEISVDTSYLEQVVPQVTWWQNESYLSISIEVTNIVQKTISYEDQTISFRAISRSDETASKLVSFDFDLFGGIIYDDPDKIFENYTGRQVSIRVFKEKPGEWTSLTKQRCHNVKFDVFKYRSGDDSDDSDEKENLPMCMTSGPPGVISRGRPDFSSSGDDGSDLPTDLSGGSDLE